MTFLNVISVYEKTNKSPFQLYYQDRKEITAFVGNLKCFGEARWVTDCKKMNSKLEACAKKFIFVGYDLDHSGDVYRMYNPQTKKVILSRDIR